jgi:hypothetical protein
VARFGRPVSNACGSHAACAWPAPTPCHFPSASAVGRRAPTLAAARRWLRAGLVTTATLAWTAGPGARAEAAPRPPARALAGGHDLTGTWVGAIALTGASRALALQLHERDSHALLGYVLGGTELTTVRAGSRSGARVALTLELRDPAGITLLEVAARLRGNTMTGTVSGPGGSGTVLLRRTSDVLSERRMVFATLDDGGEPTALVRLAVAFAPSGELVAGAFASEENCSLWACSGEVTSFRETAGVLTVVLNDRGGCPGASSATVTVDPATKLYGGSYVFTGCGGTSAGPVSAARAATTRSDHVAGILSGLGRVADDFEGGAGFSVPHPAFASDYLDLGQTTADMLAVFNRERARYGEIEASFLRIRNASTVVDPGALPDLVPPTGVEADQRRSGIAVGGSERVLYLDTTAGFVEPDRFRCWTERAGAWVLIGDQRAGLDLPFEYTTAGHTLEVPAGSRVVHVSVGPYGGHFSPITGHGYGDAKANFVGFLSGSDADLTELAGDGDGAREPGETWGYDGGAGGEMIRSNRPVYTMPLEGELRQLRYEAPPSSTYFDSEPHWRLEIAFTNSLTMAIGHVGAIAPELRSRVLAATGTDPASYGGPVGDVLSGKVIPLARGDALACPQIMASPVPGYPAYFVGGGTFPERPWAQMEFFVGAPVGNGNAQVCPFAVMGGERADAIQQVMDTDMADPRSQRYGGVRRINFWQWSAEGRACMAYSPLPQDFTALYTNLGGWFEVDGPSTTSDEMVGFAPIAREAAMYNPGRYHSPAVDMLVVRERSTGPFVWQMPDGALVSAWEAAGEVLDRSGGVLLVKFRGLPWTDGSAFPVPVYQRSSYILGADGLKIRWGAFARNAASAAAPALAPSTPCNDTDVICYDHTYRWGF